jgi:hypothetical protein
MRAIAVFLLSFGLFTAADAASLADVQVPDSAQVAGTNLVLNGVGLRKKFFVKIYVGALYLPAKADNADAVLAHSGPDRVLMHLIYAVDKGQFTDAWHDDFKANNPDSYDALKDRLEQFIAFFGDSKQGDEITMDYVPGTGTQVSWNGTLKGTIPGEDFHKALLNVYMGLHPPTTDLKDGMLGNG